MTLETCFLKKTTVVNPTDYKPLRFHDYFRRTYYIPLIFGFNWLPFPISKSRIVRILFATYSLSLSFGCSILVLKFVKNVYCSPYLFIALEYVTTVSLLILVDVRNREKFFKKLEVIDEQLHVSTSYYNQLKTVTLVGVVFVLFTRLLYSTALCYGFKFYCDESPFVICISAFVLIAVDSNQMPRLIVFHLIKYRMRLLRIRVEDLFKCATVAVISSKDEKKNLVLYQETYGIILESISTISNIVNPFFLVSLVCSFPKIMFLLYNIIVLHKKGVQITQLLILAAEAVQWGFIACLPGIVFETTRAQVDKLKVTLLQRYKKSSSTDEVIQAEIKEFLNYIELRPCRYYLYRLISVDITLPVGLFHLCTTYLIVMIQFSHLFEDTTY
ncbi:uncharacterized protein [Choristoneura fumiferana]|uniref:uncharacterized protein n=1 Tax=Choristoneura fumiferana TaxID=7141 RepID=UPI003D15CA99